MHDSMTSPLVALRKRRLSTSGCPQPTAGSGFLHFRKCFPNMGKGIVDTPCHLLPTGAPVRERGNFRGSKVIDI
ncbi:hypothetical protein DPMN_142745 [Dreissena polymorpha]|uniref:Uncharacterized protein n=1 Tax=Dreissena polymorpha TaxID=45954 RepID=A0A9D4JIZ4_DREPO|nr:hypothetical protein DPMN_142745 [Dreissena polymorpha]